MFGSVGHGLEAEFYYRRACSCRPPTGRQHHNPDVMGRSIDGDDSTSSISRPPQQVGSCEGGWEANQTNHHVSISARSQHGRSRHHYPDRARDAAESWWQSDEEEEDDDNDVSGDDTSDEEEEEEAEDRDEQLVLQHQQQQLHPGVQADDVVQPPLPVHIPHLQALHPFLARQNRLLAALYGDPQENIYTAAYQGNLEAVICLTIQQPGVVNLVHPIFKFSPLHLAAYQGHFEVAEFLVDQGAQINLRQERSMISRVHGYTPFHLACRQGHGELAEFLLQRGADPSLQVITEEEPTILKKAVSSGDAATVRSVLTSRAVRDTIDNNYGQFGTALGYVMCSTKKVDPEITRLLLDNGADPTADVISHQALLEASRAPSGNQHAWLLRVSYHNS